jgi:hypothetical protein
MDERIDELLFALRSAVESTAMKEMSEDYEEQVWRHVRKRLAELVDEVLK